MYNINKYHLTLWKFLIHLYFIFDWILVFSSFRKQNSISFTALYLKKNLVSSSVKVFAQLSLDTKMLVHRKEKTSFL